MDYSDRNRLLDPKPMPLELGYERLPDGVLHIAVRTDMHHCSGDMLEWWFASRIGTREYKWWHPLDHISSSWREGVTGAVPGSVHLVEERFTELPATKLSIQFGEPAEFYDPKLLSAARQAGHVSAAFCIRGGAGHEAERTPDGAIIGTRLLHVARDTPWGMVLRSHFFLGQDLVDLLGMPAPQIESIFPDVVGPNMLQHCYDEFTWLSRVLPGLWMAEGAPKDRVVRPW
jgi:hypothetical protein